MKFIDSYNKNEYIKILKILIKELPLIEQFLKSINEKNDFKNIDDLEEYYNTVFCQKIIEEHFDFKISKIYKPLYLRNPGPHTKGNSYYHLTLKLESESILWLDNLYGNLLQRFVKFYKHLFSKIDNYFITLNDSQLKAYQTFLDKIKKEVQLFLKYSDNRETLAQRKKLNPQDLTKIPFGGLFYITHIDNIKSILKLGILSHNLAHQNGFVNTDISNQSVNARRDRFELELGGTIHDFTPLYFKHKNPMLYTLCKNRDRDTLVLLKINPHILLAKNVAFSDGNASVKSTSFYKDINDFNKLNWTLINKGSWYNYEFGIQEGRRLMCSEVLAKEKIPSYYIDEIFVYSEQTLEKILPLFPNHLGINSSVNKSLYF